MEGDKSTLFLSNGCISGCRRIFNQYISGELSEDDCLAIDRHLLQCHVCRSAFDAASEEYDEGLDRRIVTEQPLTAEERYEAGLPPTTSLDNLPFDDSDDE